MKHLKEAHEAMLKEGRNDIFWDTKPRKHSVEFIIQKGPIKEAGIGLNGCQAEDMLAFIKHLFVSLNNEFPCAENEKTILHIKQALDWQSIRTENREKRGVEGLNQV